MQKIAFLPDAHRPYHDKIAWELFLLAISDWKPDILVCLGDLADCYKVSSFSKDPTREYSFKEEIDNVLEGLDDLDALGATRKIFVAGNHEHRLVRYLQEKAPELFEFIDIPKLLELEKRGWEYVPYKSAIQLGKLWITHDVGVAGRYSVFRAADTFQHPVVMAHTHRLVYVVEGNATGDTFPAVQFGWLGDVEKLDYVHKVAAKRSHCLAFGAGLLDEETGWIYLTPHPIVNYTVVVDGRRYKI
jgi:predicted phosphodiesterase